jgi:hypothetical protein
MYMYVQMGCSVRCALWSRACELRVASRSPASHLLPHMWRTEICALGSSWSRITLPSLVILLKNRRFATITVHECVNVVHELYSRVPCRSHCRLQVVCTAVRYAIVTSFCNVIYVICNVICNDTHTSF